MYVPLFTRCRRPLDCYTSPIISAIRWGKKLARESNEWMQNSVLQKIAKATVSRQGATITNNIGDIDVHYICSERQYGI